MYQPGFAVYIALGRKASGCCCPIPLAQEQSCTMPLQSLFTWKSARFIVVTVVLGAVGSGVWEWVLKPALAGTSDTVLSVATLGISAFKDALYKEVAQGFREDPSLRLYNAVFAFAPLMLLGFISGFWTAARSQNSDTSDSRLERAVSWFDRPVLILTIFMLLFSVVQAAQVSYVNRAVTHFHQLLAIAGPYMTEEQRLSALSRFAQVASGEDYERLVIELDSLCRGKGQRTPAFAVW